MKPFGRRLLKLPRIGCPPSGAGVSPASPRVPPALVFAGETPAEAAGTAGLLRTVALELFWALAFLPAITHLLRFPGFLTNPLPGMGPVAAGFWLAGAICGTRLSFALLAAMLSILVWLVNWLMLAGGDCCSIGG